MTKTAFKNLLIYLKYLNQDNKQTLIKETLMEYLSWFNYSVIYLNKNYTMYINQLTQCLIYTYTNNIVALNNYLEDYIIYWDLATDEEDL